MSLSLSTPARGRPIFTSREAAGRSLAERLRLRDSAHEALVLALSAKALPVARAMARELPAPLDLALVRRLRLPGGMTVGAVSLG